VSNSVVIRLSKLETIAKLFVAKLFVAKLFAAKLFLIKTKFDLFSSRFLLFVAILKKFGSSFQNNFLFFELLWRNFLQSLVSRETKRIKNYFFKRFSRYYRFLDIDSQKVLKLVTNSKRMMRQKTREI
jgi:hypothetical protein